MARISIPAIAGTVGTTDNAIPRADGTGGRTLQGSSATISDTGNAAFASTSMGAPVALTNNSADAGGYSPALLSFSSSNTNSLYENSAGTEPLYGGFVTADSLIRVDLNGHRGNVGNGESTYPYYLMVYVPDCWLAGTMVDVPGGQRPIEEIQVGDSVLSMNEFSGDIIANEVEHKLVHPNRPGYYLLNEKSRATGNHRVFANGGWEKRVSDLKIGDWLWNAKREKVWVYSLEEFAAPGTVSYNLKLKYKGLPNYFADGLFVHNKCPFVYSYDISRKQPWVYENTFLYELDCPEKRATQRRKLKTLTNELFFRELEPEVSYIAEPRLIAKTPSGEVTLECLTKLPSVLVLRQGDIVPVRFEALPDDTQELYLEATGYYIGTE